MKVHKVQGQERRKGETQQQEIRKKMQARINVDNDEHLDSDSGLDSDIDDLLLNNNAINEDSN